MLVLPLYEIPAHTLTYVWMEIFKKTNRTSWWRYDVYHFWLLYSLFTFSLIISHIFIWIVMALFKINSQSIYPSMHILYSFWAIFPCIHVCFVVCWDANAFLFKIRRLLMESNFTIGTHLHTALIKKNYIPESPSGLSTSRHHCMRT